MMVIHVKSRSYFHVFYTFPMGNPGVYIQGTVIELSINLIHVMLAKLWSSNLFAVNDLSPWPFLVYYPWQLKKAEPVDFTLHGRVCRGLPSSAVYMIISLSLIKWNYNFMMSVPLKTNFRLYKDMESILIQYSHADWYTKKHHIPPSRYIYAVLFK